MLTAYLHYSPMFFVAEAVEAVEAQIHWLLDLEVVAEV
jgi:hypothetical protein